MSFASHATSLLLSSPNRGGLPPLLHIPATISPPRSTAGAAPLWELPFTARSLRQYKAISRALNQEYVEIQKGSQVVLAAEKSLEDSTEKHTHQEAISEKTRELVERIRWMLQNMDDGEISVSPYDTAWVALVEDIGGSGQPQFPTSLEWISNNQFTDGSWGGDRKFLLYDRILNTLACVVALTNWKMHPDKCDKGLKFIRENIHKVEYENEDHMPVGFEVALPSLINMAKKLGIEIPDDSPGMQDIYAKRDLKLKKIPMYLLHKKPTSLLYSLEGMEGLDWQKLLNFRFEGSFLSSPSSTAYALQHTKDQLCLEYLLKPVKKFNGGVPNVYPVDMFEHLWSVDRLQRLGISRYFQPEIEECMKYAYRYWTNKGICWARNTNVQDVDDSSMGFRLLRLHGFDVTIDAFKQFEKGGEFCSIPGQASHAITGMYNMYRCSQVLFPGEHILADAKKYAAKFLHEKRVNNAVVDKWIITKDLPGEVAYALDVPFYASLPRLEARFFLEHYGGGDDVWIGKTLYRMLYVNCDTYLELAKLDYNNCQAVHQDEWKSIQKWCTDCSLGEFGLSERSLLLAYYIASSTVFEPEKSGERLAWAKTAILVETILSQQLSSEQKREFVNEFKHGSILKNENGGRYKTRISLVETLINTVSELSTDIVLAQGRDIHLQLYHVWQKWLTTWEEGGDLGEAEVELLLRTLHLSSGLEESLFSHPKYQQLLEVTSNVCHHLRLFQNRKVHNTVGPITDLITGTTFQIEAGMQELVKLVFTKSSGDLDSLTKQSFFAIARSFYYTAYCDPGAIDSHMDKVLFQKVV
uniref:Terpene synthase 2 n=1 Tax=Callicarpa americana TaxID=204211 RepID=A0A7G5M449_CALAM|nr:terpene synthase 2 [Callicarpa americana]